MSYEYHRAHRVPTSLPPSPVSLCCLIYEGIERNTDEWTNRFYLLGRSRTTSTTQLLSSFQISHLRVDQKLFAPYYIVFPALEDPIFSCLTAIFFVPIRAGLDHKDDRSDIEQEGNSLGSLWHPSI